ncbi:AAA family ATPase [Paraburkholderia sp. SIMBA_055]
MRPIQTLLLENFRGFAGARKIDLDADLVLISGKNGVGKSSIILALNLLLNGQTSFCARQGQHRNRSSNEGSIESIGGFAKRLSLADDMKPGLYADLLERAHFFFPDTLDTPEAATDVIAILQPQVSAWSEIKPALEQAMDVLKERRKEFTARPADVEDARRVAARRFEQTRLALDGKTFDWIVPLKDEQSLLLTGGNLSNHWQSQIRNLLMSVSEVVGATQSPSDDVAQNLGRLGEVLRTLANRVIARVDAPQTRETHLFALENRLSFPDHSSFSWSEIPPTTYVSDTGAILLPVSERADQEWILRIGFLQEQRRKLERQRHDLLHARDSLVSREGSLDDVLTQIHERGSSWLTILSNPVLLFDDGRRELSSWLTDALENSGKMQHTLELIGERIDAEMRVITEHLSANAETENLLQHAVACAQVLRSFRGEAWVENADDFGELRQYVERVLREERHKLSTSERVAAQLLQLANEAENWSNTERAVEADILRAREAGAMKGAEKVFMEAERTVKRALATDGIFSLTSEIDGKQLRLLLQTLNRLLARFHFPKDFLPISLSRATGRGKPAYRFVSKAGVDYQGLSTGQKTQLAVCWSVCLSYALRDSLVAPVIAFDDFTTALDLGQLIPAAGILRQLAYSSSTEYQRQVIVTSHHEDMTNRLVDYLVPPAGKSMKVIHIDEWTTSDGPDMQVYNARRATNEAVMNQERLGEWLRTQMHGRL